MRKTDAREIMFYVAFVSFFSIFAYYSRLLFSKSIKIVMNDPDEERAGESDQVVRLPQSHVIENPHLSLEQVILYKVNQAEILQMAQTISDSADQLQNISQSEQNCTMDSS